MPFLCLGFPNEATLVRRIASSLRAKSCLVKTGVFPAGETWIKGSEETPRDCLVIGSVWEDPASLFRVLLLAESLRATGTKRLFLLAPWIAYGRQDRVVFPGDAPAGLITGRLLSQAFDHIWTLDAHSERFIGSFAGKLTNVLTEPPLKTRGSFDLVLAPDQGARERASHIAKKLRIPSAALTKTRDGQRVCSCLPRGLEVTNKRILLVDDMADSGGTLIVAAELLRQARAKSVAAFVPHALDLKKLQKRTKGKIEPLLTAFDHKTGRLAPYAQDALKRAFLTFTRP